MALELSEADVWGIFIDNDTKQVVWKTDNLPDTVPTTYTLSDIASLTRGYISDYPTFTGEAENGLVVLGYPKKSFWKHMWSSWDYQLIANLPKTVLTVLIINVIVIFIIYVTANTKLLKSIKPITKGIQDLSVGEPVQIKESGLLSEISANINRTSDICLIVNTTNRTIFKMIKRIELKSKMPTKRRISLGTLFTSLTPRQSAYILIP